MSVSEQDVKHGHLNDQLASQLESISARVEAKVERGWNAWADFKADAEGCCREMASTVSDYVREQPWQVIGMAAGIGLLLGLLCGRR